MRSRKKTSILKFQPLLGIHGLAGQLLEAVNAYFGQQGLLLRQGTIVNANIIHVPSSTKVKEGKLDPGMRQAKKGNQFFGLKAHIGVDIDLGLVHTVTTTPVTRRT